MMKVYVAYGYDHSEEHSAEAFVCATQELAINRVLEKVKAEKGIDEVDYEIVYSDEEHVFMYVESYSYSIVLTNVIGAPQE